MNLTSPEIVAAVCLVFLAYVYVGYPVLLGLMCLFRRRNGLPHVAMPDEIVSVVVCARNAERLIGQRIRNLAQQRGLPGGLEIVVVSDGSCDGTVAEARKAESRGQGAGGEEGISLAEAQRIVESRGLRVEHTVHKGAQSGVSYSELRNSGIEEAWLREPGDQAIQQSAIGNPGTAVRVIEFKESRGKAAVLNEVIPLCRGRFVVLADVRQSFETDAIAQLCRRLEGDEGLGAVSGELVFEKGAAHNAEGVGVYWDYEKMLRRMESCLASTCGCTGAIYAIRKECFIPLDPRTVLDDVALPMLMVLAGKRVVFEDRAKAVDVRPSDLNVERQRKVRTLAGNYQLAALYPKLLSPLHNPVAFQFWSHKLLRLACPWALIVLLGATIVGAMSVPWLTVLLAVQGLFYGLALMGLTLWGRIKIFSLPAAFVVLNVSAVRGLGCFLSSRLSPSWEPSQYAEGWKPQINADKTGTSHKGIATPRETRE